MKEYKYDVLTSGYVSMDHIIKIAEPARVGFTSIVTNADNTKNNYGGCGVNIASALCRLGKRAMPVLRVGPDWEENGFRAYLTRNNIPTDAVTVIHGEATSTCYLLQDKNGDHITIFYPGSMDKKHARPIDSGIFENTRLGVITVASKPDNRYFLEGCKAAGVPVAFGMKDDMDAFPVDFLRELLESSTIIFTNEVERELIEQLYGCDGITKLFEIGRALYIVTTLGGSGSIVYEKTDNGFREHRIPTSGISKEEIVDTTGSGDAYMSGFLYGVLNNRPAVECGCLGAALADFVLRDVGCCSNLPTAEQLEAKMTQIKERIK